MAIQSKRTFGGKEIFRKARQFDKAASVIWKSQNVNMSTEDNFSAPLLTPHVVCLAFALELYLKSLFYFTSGKSSGPQHSLVKLFNGISADAQAEVKTYWLNDPLTTLERQTRASISGTPEDTFEIMLAYNDRAFERWRYIYESESGWTGPGLVRAVRACLVNRYAEVREFI